jgi:hypothetical protein
VTIREASKIEDIQRCVHGLIKKLETATAPWSSWGLVFGYPETSVFENLSKPFIYVEAPTLVDFVYQQGGGKKCGIYTMLLGAWDDNKTGRDEEINIISSKIISLFNDPSTCHTTQFDVTLGSAYTNTTLIGQGIRITGCLGPSIIDGQDLKEFRREFQITIRA